MCCTRLAENTGRKSLHFGTIAQLCRTVFAAEACIDDLKKIVKQRYASTCPHNMVNFGLLTVRSVGEFGAPLQISTAFASWQRYCMACSSGRQPNFAALNRGRHLYSAGRPSRWALAHILVFSYIHCVPKMSLFVSL